MYGNKRKLSAYDNDIFVSQLQSDITPKKKIGSLLPINPINESIASFNNINSLFSQIRKQNILCDSSKEIINNNQSELELKELQLKAARAQFEAANVSKIKKF